MDVLVAVRLIRENTFQTTREVLKMTEDELESNRDTILRAYELAQRLWDRGGPSQQNSVDQQELNALRDVAMVIRTQREAPYE